MPSQQHEIPACPRPTSARDRYRDNANDVEGLVATFKAVFDERAQHPVLLVHAVEERANVTMLAEIAAGTSHGTAVRYHLSPPSQRARKSRANASEQIILFKGLA